MGFFSFLFGGKYPSTKKYEAQLEKEAIDFERFKQIASSANYAKYLELQTVVNSAEFKQKVNKLKTEKFKDTEAYRKEQECKQLKNSSDIKQYLKFKSKQLDQRLSMAKQSSEYNRFTELKQIVSTPEFRAAQASKDFKRTAEHQTLKEFERLSKSSAVKFISKTEASDAYKNFTRVEGSDRLKKYEQLEEYINSSEFKSFKAEMEDSKRFNKSAEAQTIKEFESLTKNSDIVWYEKALKANTFGEMSKRKLVFSDDFNGFDKQKWTLGYFWGKTLANTNYSLMNERQTFTEKNIHASASELTISTRKESAKGKVWNPAIGFVDGNFDYTSALINNGASFRQKYGRFDFKVKMSLSTPVVHNIWMIGEKQVPMINIVNFGGDKKNLRVGTVSENGSKTVTVDGANFNEYYIISLIWTADKLTWLINGVEVHTQKNNVPQEPMFINISSNISAKGDVANAEMTIDWVKVYSLE